MSESVLAGTAPLVVCIDGSEDGARALLYAVREALRAPRVLRLVHVVHETMPLAPMLPLFTTDALRSVGLHILQDAAEQVRALSADRVVVEEVLCHGPRVSAILASAHPADCAGIVMGPRSSRLHRLVAGSTTTGVVARAQVPVLCVPETWHPDRVAGRVVVGIADLTSAELVEPALRRAEALGARLTMLHAWRPQSQYDSAIGGRVLADIWERESEQALWELVAGLRADHPDVEIDLDLRYQRPSVALSDASRDADLLLLGRRAHLGPAGMAVGSHTRAMIHASACPVEVLALPVRVPVTSPGTHVPHQGGTVRDGTPEPVG